MAEPTHEALVIAVHEDPGPVLDELRARTPVAQALPPRLALVALPAGTGAAVPRVPGTDWYVDELPADVYQRLNEAERLFVDGWRDRRHRKRRPGDKLPWDAPGHLPPDRPAPA